MPEANDTTPVEYRGITEHPGYSFGSDGSAWSERSGEWVRLRPSVHKSGHLTISLWVDHKSRPIYLHRLIASAFHGPCPPGMECRHLDGNPANNRPDNLRWGTRQENIDDQRRHGVLVRGERVNLAKLTEDQVREIRQLRATEGYTLRKLGVMFGVAHCTIRQVLDRTTWGHVQ